MKAPKNTTEKTKNLAKALRTKVDKHLPAKEHERKLIQARINEEIYEQLRETLKEDGLEIREFIEAAALAYLEEGDDLLD